MICRRAIFLLMSCLFAAASASAATDAMRRAASAEREGNLEEALSIYVHAVVEVPGDLRARAQVDRLARRLRSRRQRAFEAARRDYAREAGRRWAANKNKRREWKSRCREGIDLLKKRKYFEASDVFARVLEESPGFPAAERGLARMDKKGASLLRARKFPSEAHELALRGLLAFNGGRYDRACDAFDQVLAAPPVQPPLDMETIAERRKRAGVRLEAQREEAARRARFEKGKEAYDAGKFKESRDIFRDIVKQDPQNRAAQAYLSALEKLLGQVQAGVSEEVKKKEVSDRMLRGTLFYAKQQYLEALEELMKVLELDPGNRDAKEQLQEVKEAMAGENIYVPTGAPESADTDAKFKEGLRSYGNGEYEAARDAFQEVLKINPKHASARQALEKVEEVLKESAR